MRRPEAAAPILLGLLLELLLGLVLRLLLGGLLGLLLGLMYSLLCSLTYSLMYSLMYSLRQVPLQQVKLLTNLQIQGRMQIFGKKRQKALNRLGTS